MPPKPRPRPRAVRQPSVSASSPPDPSSSKTSPPAPPVMLDVDAEDAMFMKNRNRSAQVWKALERKDELAEKSARAAPAGGSDDDDQDRTPVKHRKNRRKNEREGSSLPAWTKSKNNAIVISDSDSDSDVVEGGGDGTPTRAGARDGGVNGKRKRARSRSKSITPPPELSAQQIQNARNIVKQALDPAPRRRASPTTDDLEELALVLDPELERIARKVRAQPLVRTSSSKNASRAASEAGGPDDVAVKVSWLVHPLAGGPPPQTWSFKIRRDDNFIELFDAIADSADVLVSNLVVLHDNKRLFASATPESLGVWAEVAFEACSKPTHEYLRAERDRARSPSLHPSPPQSLSFLAPSPPKDADGLRAPSPGSASEDDSQPSNANTFKLMLRSAGTSRDIAVTVRPTTMCRAIVAAFVKKAGLDARRGAKAQLVVDGDKMDPNSEIGEADLEDGDMVEVVGL